MGGVPENASIGELRKRLALFELIFENMSNGCVVTDRYGYITHFNKPYGAFLGLDPKKQIGKHCTEVIENTRMHIVAQKGQPEINEVQEINGRRSNMVVQRIPIRRNGQVVAVFGQVIFKDVKELECLANELSVLESKIRLYEEELINLRSTRYTIDSIVGTSPVMSELRKEVLLASQNRYPVLVTGESGTGKELFAQAVHHSGSRKLFPFVRINCAAIPKDLLEAELFGYERGAFTGARSRGKPGKIELAHKGTLFLDEIGDLPMQMQPKLLNILEEKTFERVGGMKLRKSDFRLIAATNQDLDKMMAAGRFRKDLFYRLNVIPLNIPPLRERPEDITALSRHFIDRLSLEAGLQTIDIEKSALGALACYAWPGNVRELSNVVESVIARLDAEHVIRTENLPFYIKKGRRLRKEAPPLSIKEVTKNAERDAILLALKESGNNKSEAARRLGIHRTQLYKKLRKYGLHG